MCSFTFSNKKIDDKICHDKFLSNRGPDQYAISNFEGFWLSHHLLSLTKNYVSQPFIDGKIALLFNGEIYNYDETCLNDVDFIIKLYKEKGEEFIKYLDGEFSICLLDTLNHKIIVSSDIFKTKPLFISIENGEIGISTFKTPLEKLGFKNILQFEKNCTLILDSKSFDVLNKRKVYEFNLQQYKTNFEDWILAFEKSIKKRTEKYNKKIFIGLSCGYDSGGICCELLKQNINFTSYSILGSENEDVINQRLKLLKQKNIKFLTENKSNELYKKHNNYIVENTELFVYTICSSSSNYTEYIKLTDDGGSNWFSVVCELAKKDGCKICLSSVGADEIISDYGFNGHKIFPHSNFGGSFPDDLNSIFPWNSFYNSSMESYIAKEEYVGSSYGLEIRYPFLDKFLVQEFLNLDNKLKNQEYKSALSFYLKNNNFPFECGIKRGF